jgi:hypothetical protein
MSFSVDFTLNRDAYRGLITLGQLYAPDKTMIAYTLEDCVRAWGIKDAKRTAIPCTSGLFKYRLSVTYSNKFKRMMPIVFTEGDKITLRNAGIEFKGIRMHGANTQEDIEGCIGVGDDRIPDAVLNQLAQSTKKDIEAQWLIRKNCEDRINALIQKYESQGYDCYLIINNIKQDQ